MNDKPINDYSYEQFLKEWKIMGSRCKKCGALALPPRPICVSCLSNSMEWIEFKGTGKLASFTSISVAPPNMAKEGFSRKNPYIVGVVELDEGPKMVARIVGLDAKNPDRIKMNIPVKSEFLSKGEGESKQTILVFRPNIE